MYVAQAGIEPRLLFANRRQSLLYGSHRYTAQYIDDFEKPCFDFDTLRRHVERLVVVSADMQAFSSKVRRLYRWEDPAYTAKWMTLYFFLWYLEHIMTFAVSQP